MEKLNHLLAKFAKYSIDVCLMKVFNTNLDPIKSMSMAKQYIIMILRNGMVPSITNLTRMTDRSLKNSY